MLDLDDEIELYIHTIQRDLELTSYDKHCYTYEYDWTNDPFKVYCWLSDVINENDTNKLNK